MKNLTFFVLALFMATNTFAQKGVKIGLHFTPGASMGLNDEDFDKGETLNLSGAFGWDLGLTVGYGFNDKLSLVTGIGFMSHTAAFVHDRANFSSGAADPNAKKKFSRTLGYVRVPLYLQIGGAGGEDGGGFFFRFGPTFNFLTGARYKDERFVGYSKYDAAIADNPQGLDVNKQTDLWATTDGGKLPTNVNKTGAQGAIYESFVLGMGLDIGGQIKLAENFHMTITLHLETTLTNVEGIGAASYANNISGDVIAANASDGLKYITEATPFDATYPNYTAEANKYATSREPTFNVFGGLTFGFMYTIAVD